MSETKYGKYFITEPHQTFPESYDRHLRILSLSKAVVEETDQFFSISTLLPRHEPLFMITDSHKHDAVECFGFLGTDPIKWWELGAEIEMVLGEEREVHTITQSTILYVPAGIPHCPLTFKTIEKPILFFIFAPGGNAPQPDHDVK